MGLVRQSWSGLLWSGLATYGMEAFGTAVMERLVMVRIAGEAQGMEWSGSCGMEQNKKEDET